MVINEQILESLGAITQYYEVGESIFAENDTPKYYYQIINGKVKLNNYNSEGREILHNILEKGHSIGESLLFIDDIKYPVNAVTVTNSKILKLPKASFFELLNTYPEISIDLHRYISRVVYFKHVMGQILCTQSAVVKLTTLLNYFKSMQQRHQEPFTFQIPFTRQELANFTGLCVETIVRTIKSMEKSNIVRICNRKVLY